jgi:hypothetical protein
MATTCHLSFDGSPWHEKHVELNRMIYFSFFLVWILAFWMALILVDVRILHLCGFVSFKMWGHTNKKER